jgi:hypothetical protein
MLETRGRLVLVVAITIAVSSLGCATANKEVDLPPQSLTQAPTSTAEQEAALVSTGRSKPVEGEDEDPFDDEVAEKPATADAHAEGAALETAGRKHTIVIQSGGTNNVVTPRTLQQASESERERRAGANTPVAVITNQNLSELAEGGTVTIIAADGKPLPTAAKAGEGSATTPAATSVAAPPAGQTATAQAAAGNGATATSAPAAGSTAATNPAAASAALTEEYWRSQALKIRLDWKTAVEEVDELQAEVADLRRRFYQEDDPFYRDNEIKPSWDRALDRLQEAKSAAEAQERKLSRFLDEGHRAGALPGWLREGIEYEPPPTSDNTPSERRRSDDPWEPKVLEEEPRDR